jgi:hypothetical protein
MKNLFCVVLWVVGLCAPARGTVLFDFENAPSRTPLPIDLTVGGISAHFAATGSGFSIQPANTYPPAPQGFSGQCIFPSGVTPADLQISFSTTLTDFSILYAPDELNLATSATMRVTAYMNGVYVGTNTKVAEAPGTWPSSTLSFSSLQGFDSVVVHYDSAPPGAGQEEYVPIFMADNLNVTAVVPEPAGLAGLALGLAALRRRRRSA